MEQNVFFPIYKQLEKEFIELSYFIKQANINNLVSSIAALFLLNVYYKDQKFYLRDNHDIEPIEAEIKGFSNVFEVDFAMDVSEMVTKRKLFGLSIPAIARGSMKVINLFRNYLR